ncbi:MAG: (deoxy)nucleoside triphosphate pyrophosphohydrolase [Bacilli bacterium]|nr:(deoxy)nucleoside triphosphate pyrophosphohydrolase [Bacilli bacterium]
MNNMGKHYEVVAALIVRGEEIFCCQRGNKGECALKWEFPGGKIEQDESHEEALIREIKEELNSTIKVIKYITTIQHQYNSFSLTMHVYECELVEGKLELSEHLNFMWLRKERLNQVDFADADKKIVSVILHNLL